MQIKAGKMLQQGKLLTADPRSGILSFCPKEELEGMIQCTWQECTASLPEDEIYLLPDDCTFKRVQQCSTGRVYCLRFTSAPSKKLYFWLQVSEQDLPEDQLFEQITSILSPSPKVTANPVLDLQAAIKALKPITLQQVFTDREILTLMQTPELKEKLWNTLPPSLKAAGLSCEQVVRSPQFSYTLAMFEEALKGGELNSVLLSLGLDPSIGTSFGGGVRRLLEAIVQKARLEENSE